MMTPPMFYPQEDGKLTEIPAEHAAILDLYRDRMPLVYEIQEFGDPMMYDLIDVDAEPFDTPEPGELETVAARVARYLKGKRLGKDPVPPDFERLAVAAIRARVEDMGILGGSLAHDEGPLGVERSVKEATAQAGRSLRKAVNRAVSDTAADLVENWWVKA
ncbi:hypothetical protein [Streptomyces sp. MZ04]|uniref:hypothetical protein n=1 Tax=Streptomyces sp. MZ04 TaxID=2559236 RepID=UPI00107E95C5|nr:hypothetical protein [Streptomyces sp. MZ04]TGB09789.1 hypothetical protein E2651_15680 [Streptomyces sp. MZ04]